MDHVLVVGKNRKLLAVVRNRLQEDDFVEVNFYTKTKNKGWSMLDMIQVIKMSEMERKNITPYNKCSE